MCVCVCVWGGHNSIPLCLTRKPQTMRTTVRCTPLKTPGKWTSSRLVTVNSERDESVIAVADSFTLRCCHHSFHFNLTTFTTRTSWAIPTTASTTVVMALLVLAVRFPPPHPNDSANECGHMFLGKLRAGGLIQNDFPAFSDRNVQ